MKRSGRTATAAAAGLVIAIAAASASAGRNATPYETPHASPVPRVDLVAQTAWDGSRRSVLTVRVLDADIRSVSLRAQLHEPVESRSELASAIAGEPTTALVWSWPIDGVGTRRAGEDARIGQMTGDEVQVRLPDGAMSEWRRRAGGGGSASGLFPLHIELADSDGTVLHTMRAFLHAEPAPGAPATTPDEKPADAPDALAVAVVFDLRLPLAHDARETAVFDHGILGDAVRLATAINESSTPNGAPADRGAPDDRGAAAATIALHTETLDALALTGDTAAIGALLAPLPGSRLLRSPWTDLDADALVAAGRGDILLDGLRRGDRALRNVDVVASSVMWLDSPPSPRTVSWLTKPTTGVAGFITRPPDSDAPAGDTAQASAVSPNAGNAPPHPPVPPVTALADADGGSHRTAVADPFPSRLLAAAAAREKRERTESDPELAVHQLLTELTRMARSDAAPEAVIVHSPVITPNAAGLLLDGLRSNSALLPVTVEAVLAGSDPVGVVDPERAVTGADGPHDRWEYPERRRAVEQRLDAYESLVGADTALTPHLRTLLAASAARPLHEDARNEFLAAIDRNIREGTRGIELTPTGRITLLERTADLPLTILNRQPAAVTVAVELASASESVDFPGGDRPIARLDPGRNHLSVPVRVAAPGEAVVDVTIATPATGPPIVLSTGHRRLRLLRLSGVGTLISVGVAAGLALWWGRSRRFDRTGPDDASAPPVDATAAAMVPATPCDKLAAAGEHPRVRAHRRARANTTEPKTDRE